VGEVSPGDALHPGDAIRFRVTAAESGFLVILGIDAAPAVTVYAAVTPIDGGEPLVVDGSIILDATIGAERIVAVVCAEPLPAEDLAARATARLLSAGGDPRQVRSIADSCAEASLLIEKVAR
jgi:hypothetical protein